MTATGHRRTRAGALGALTSDPSFDTTGARPIRPWASVGTRQPQRSATPKTRGALSGFPVTNLHARRPAGRRSGVGAGLVAVVVVLCLTGIVMVLSASSVYAIRVYHSPWYFFVRQLLWVTVGLAAMMVGARIDYHRWRRAAPFVLAGTILMLLAVLVPGVGIAVNGSTRWLGTGQLRIQPSEIAKLAVVVYAARLLADRAEHIDRPRSFRPLLIVTVALTAMIMLQPDMGTAIIVSLIVFADLAVAGIPRASFARIATASIVAAVGAGTAAPYRRQRLLSFLHPTHDPSGTNYQTIQGLAASASGGLLGVGLGAGLSKWGYLPNAYTDFIFAVIAQETGLLGAVSVVALFAVFAYLGIRVATGAPDPFGALLAAGITAWITGQAILNIGAVLAVLPVTGVPLPLVSYGGTSLIILLFAAGILLNIATKTPARPANPLSRART